MKRFIIALLAICTGISAMAQQEYKATVFGAKSDGLTDNTATIQRAKLRFLRLWTSATQRAPRLRK